MKQSIFKQKQADMGPFKLPLYTLLFCVLKVRKKKKRSNHLYILMHNFTHLTKYPESQEDHKTSGQFSIFTRGPFYSVVFFLLLFFAHTCARLSQVLSYS